MNDISKLSTLYLVQRLDLIDKKLITLNDEFLNLHQEYNEIISELYNRFPSLQNESELQKKEIPIQYIKKK